MAAPTFFTIVGDFRSVITDVLGDKDYDPDFSDVVATVSFTPLVTPGQIIRAPYAKPRPLGILPTRIEGFIDTDGRLKLYSDPEIKPITKTKIKGYDYSPIRLLADTKYLDLGGQPLYYQVTFKDVVYNGLERRLKPIVFQAPTVDVELNLISLLGVHHSATAITPPVGSIAILPTSARIERKQLIFTVQGVDIPAPIDISGFGELSAADLERVRQELLRGIKVVDDKIVVTNPKTGEMLVWNGTEWVNTAAGYTRAEIDGKLSGLASGLARKPAVVDMLNDPPATPAVGATYIIDKTPTGDWVAHENDTVFWDGSQWVFGPPNKGDTHTVLSSNASMTWNGTDWVSVGSQAAKLGELDDVTLGAIPSSGDVVSWDGAKWVNNPVPKPALGEITDVDLLGVQPNQVLEFDGTKWVPVSLPGRNLDALVDVNVPAPLGGDILSFDTVTNKWVGLAPKLVTSPLNGLTDVTATTPSEGDVLRWDAVAGQWVNRVLPSTLDDLSDVDVDVAMLNDGDMLAWDGSKWSPVVLRLDTDALEDVSLLSPQNEDFLVFNGAEWENRPVPLGDLADLAVSSPVDGEVLTYDGGVWFNQAPAAVPQTLGALTDVDTSGVSAGKVLSFDGTGWVAAATAQTINDLTDVDTSAAADKTVLQWDGSARLWKPVADLGYLKPAQAYSKPEVDAKLAALMTGMIHGESVNSITNTPPAPTVGDLFIVGTAPTGAWAGQANNLAYWDGAAWIFEAPQSGESHLVESLSETWHWSGTAWVKVAAAATGGASAVGDLWVVGSIQTSWLTETQFRAALGLNSTEDRKWVLADGRNVAGSQFQTITGLTNVPDLRGSYLRMAGQNSNSQPDWNGEALRGFQG